MKSAILHIVKKEFLQFRRDRKMFGISIIAPVLQLILLGYAANIDFKNIRIVVCDMDNTKISRQYVESLTNSGYFYKVGNLQKMNDIDYYIDNGKASIGIIIPEYFGRDVLSQKTAQIQSIVDGADSTVPRSG